MLYDKNNWTEEDRRTIKTIIPLYVGVLNDDEMEILKSQYVYNADESKMDDASVKITYYTYATEWTDNKHERYFRDIESAVKWYKKEFTARVIESGRYSLEEWERVDGEKYGSDDDLKCLEEWENLVYEMNATAES